MGEAVLERPRQLPPFGAALAAVVLVAVIGVADHVTGYEVSFAVFYLAPVGLAAWYAGRRLGIAISLLSAATWLLVDGTTGHQYSHWLIPYWNAATRLGFFVVVAVLGATLRAAYDAQARLARHDGLTGIMNATAFKQHYRAVGGPADRYGHPITLGYLDIDGFKAVNDRFGHGAGDRVLREVAGALASRLRAADVGARLGGDEFAVLLPETDAAGARAFFGDLVERLDRLAAERGWPIAFSVGVVVLRPPPEDPEAAIHLADDLMYRAKGAGRSTRRSTLLVEEVGGTVSA